MAKVERSVTINADWETVDGIATDPAQQTSWFEGMEAATGDGVYPAVGGKVDYKYKASGITFDLTATVQSYQKGDHLTMLMEGMITGTQHWAYTPGDGTTRLDVTFDYTVPGGGLGKIADKLIIERVNASNLEKSLEKLKALAEG